VNLCRFSGDTQPTQNLVRAGPKPTVLIHEATMADEELELAQMKAHSTVGQAINVGKEFVLLNTPLSPHLLTFFYKNKRMSAQHILLTHFSARYSKMPLAVTVRSPSDPIIVPAFDHLDMSIGTMWKMSHYIPVLESNVSETSEDDGDEQLEAPEGLELDMDWDHQNP